MAHYSALIVQRHVRSANGNPTWEAAAPCYRIPTITSFYKDEEIPGGYKTASFTIPLEQAARLDPEWLAENTTVWISEGTGTVFHGHILKATPQRDGSVSVACNGPYAKLDDTRMRVVWADDDMSQWQTSPRNQASGQMTMLSDGTLEFRMSAGQQHNVGEHLAADYFLFGEVEGPRDRKRIDGFLFEQARSTFADGNFEFRVYGMTDPTDTAPDLLFASQASGIISGKFVSDGSSGDDTNGWPVQIGYRNIRIGLWCIAAVNIPGTGADRILTFSQLRCSTRARSIRLLDFHQTSTLAQDLWDDAANGYDVHHLLQEEAVPSTGEAIVGNIQNNGQYVAGINYQQWSAPREVLEGLAGFDGYKVGMWNPTKSFAIGSDVSTSTTRQYWTRQPAELIYTSWSGLSNPDYLIRLQRGAVWLPDGQGDVTTEATYVNYTTHKGNQQSVFIEDNDLDNYLYSQGWHEAGDWSISPSVKLQTATTLGTEYNNSLRQPFLSGTITITSDNVAAIEGRGGERMLKLSAVRSGAVVRIVDAKGPQAGRITGLTFTARTPQNPDTLVLTVNDPVSRKLDKHLVRLTQRDSTSRIR